MYFTPKIIFKKFFLAAERLLDQYIAISFYIFHVPMKSIDVIGFLQIPCTLCLFTIRY